jgi:cysteine-rich repeat protein
VLKATNAEDALTVLRSGIKIDLLFSDVVMPGPIPTRELARRAQDMQPGISVLFTSGYTQNAIVHNGVLDAGESCDDGATGDGDGCSSTCFVEDHWSCSGAPSVCTPNCGNGTLEVADGQRISDIKIPMWRPGALNGMGVRANYSYTTSEARGIPLRTDSPSLLRQAPHTWNVSPTYDRGRLSMRLGMLAIPTLLDVAHPPVLDGQPHHADNEPGRGK